MKIRKSLLCLLLSLIMLMPASAFAAGDSLIEFKAAQYSSTNGVAGNNFQNYSSFVTFGMNAFLEYTAEITNPGTYHLTLELKGGEGKGLQVLANGTEIKTIAPAIAEYSQIYIGAVELVAGKNTIRLVSTGSLIDIRGLTLEKGSAAVEPTFAKSEGAFKNYFLPTKIQAEDFDLKGAAADGKSYIVQDYRSDSPFTISQTSGGASAVSVSTGEGMRYTFNVEEEGIYSLKIKAMGETTLCLTYDGAKGRIYADTAAGEEADGGTVYLKSGKHTLDVVVVGMDTALDYFKFVTGSGEYISLSDLDSGDIFEIEKKAEEKKENPVWRQFYVSPDGDDSAAGTAQKPFKSIDGAKKAIEKLSENMKGDIVVNILPGRYEIEEKIVFSEKDSGKNGYNIIYRGTDSKNKPIIDGGRQITGWEKLNDKIWTAKAEDISEMRQMYVNGFGAQRARAKYKYAADKVYDDPETTSPQDGFYISKVNFPVMSNVEDVEFVFNLLWTSQRVPVKEIRDDGDKYLVIYDQPYFSYAITRDYQETAPLSGQFFYPENAPELIDEAGEFYFDKNTKTVYYYPFPEEDMENAEVYTPVSEGLILAEGSGIGNKIKNIIFDNLDFRHGAWNDVSRTGVSFFQADAILPERDNVVEVHSCDTLPIAVWFNNADNVHVTNCNFMNLGLSAVGFIENVENSSAVGNVIRDISGSGVVVGHWRYTDTTKRVPDYITKKINVENNVIRRVGNEFYDCVGIGLYYVNSCTVKNNYIDETPYTGITMGWGWGGAVSRELCQNNRITDNRIVNVSNTVVDGGPIYTLSEQKYSIVSGNYLTSNGNDYGGIYFDQGSKNITAFDNVIEGPNNAFFGGTMNGDVWDLYNNYTNVVDQSSYVPWGPARTETYMELKERPVRYELDNWGAPAREIMAKAGLADEYSHLLDGTSRPEWRTNFMCGGKKDSYKAQDIIEVAAKDYMPGGEGVGFHKNKAGEEPKLYNQGSANIVIGGTAHGEWMNYEVDIKEENDYNFGVYYSLAYVGDEPDYTGATKVSVYLDGEIACDAVALSDTGSWNAYAVQDVGKVHLTEGKHTVRIQFVDGGFSYMKFRLLPDREAQNEKSYDDGVMFTLPVKED